MPDERMCPHCGRSNPAAMPRCINCGQRVGGGGLLLQQEEATATTRTGATEPWWQSSAGPGTSSIPLPPQIREEAARAEALRHEAQRRAEEERIAAELRAAEERKRVAEMEARRLDKLARELAVGQAALAGAPPKAAKSVLEKCPKCETPVREAGAVFSFCLNCGTDLASKPAANPVSAARPAAQQTMGAAQVRPVTHVHAHTVTMQPTAARSGVNPMLPATLSFFWPGIGQFVNGQAAKGVLLLLLAFVARRIFGWESYGFLMILIGVLSAVDGYRIADRKRSGRPVREGEWDLG